MTQVTSNAQQVHCVLPRLLLVYPVLYTKDAEYVRCISLLAMLSRFTVFCLVFCLFSLSYPVQTRFNVHAHARPSSVGQQIPWCSAL